LLILKEILLPTKGQNLQRTITSLHLALQLLKTIRRLGLLHPWLIFLPLVARRLLLKRMISMTLDWRTSNR